MNIIVKFDHSNNLGKELFPVRVHHWLPHHTPLRANSLQNLMPFNKVLLSFGCVQVTVFKFIGLSVSKVFYPNGNYK